MPKKGTIIYFSDFFFYQDYDPDLFGKALPCLSAIGCALPPDYSLSTNMDENLLKNATSEGTDGPYQPCPIEAAQ